MAIMNILMGTNGYPQEEINLESETKKNPKFSFTAWRSLNVFGKSYTDIQRLFSSLFFDFLSKILSCRSSRHNQPLSMIVYDSL